MRREKNNINSAVILCFGIAVVLAGFWFLLHPIARAQEAEPVVIARYVPPHTEPEGGPEPVLAEDPTVAPQYIYDPDIPLSQPIQEVLRQACEDADVLVALALGLIEVESRFDPQADNGKCYGLCQLNRDYFPDKLSPADNLRQGIAYLGCLLEQYGDPAAALTAYNAGYDTGNRVYANAVLAAAERWKEAAP